MGGISSSIATEEQCVREVRKSLCSVDQQIVIFVATAEDKKRLCRLLVSEQSCLTTRAEGGVIRSKTGSIATVYNVPEIRGIRCTFHQCWLQKRVREETQYSTFVKDLFSAVRIFSGASLYIFDTYTMGDSNTKHDDRPTLLL